MNSGAVWKENAQNYVFFWDDQGLQTQLRILFVFFLMERSLGVRLHTCLVKVVMGDGSELLCYALMGISEVWTCSHPCSGLQQQLAGQCDMRSRQVKCDHCLQSAGMLFGALLGLQPRLTGLARHQNSRWAKGTKSMCLAHVKKCSQPNHFSLHVIEGNWYNRYGVML